MTIRRLVTEENAERRTHKRAKLDAEVLMPGPARQRALAVVSEFQGRIRRRLEP